MATPLDQPDALTAATSPQRGPLTDAETHVCPVCGGGSRHAFDAWDRNREVTPRRFPYYRCGACRTVFLAEVPADLQRYYDTDYYPLDADGQPSWTGGAEHPAARAATYRVELIKRYVQAGRLVEIGSGNGAFAVAASRAGFDVTAMEMDERCCRYLESQPGIEAIHSDRPLDVLATLPPVDVIAIWHVLEHLLDPVAVLRRAAEMLEPGGLLAIAVPNVDSLQFRALGKRWAHVDAPRHLRLVPADTLTRLGSDAGLRRVEITTNDPDGYECNLFGWARALQRHRTDVVPPLTAKAALGLCAVLAPIERTGQRGSAVTVLMRREP